MLSNTLFAGMGLGAGLFFALALLWTIIWKGYALWIAAREGKKWWFIPILVLNTIGILEIIYIFAFSKTGKCCIANMKNKKGGKKGCDCTSCVGCECDCHKKTDDN